MVVISKFTMFIPAFQFSNTVVKPAAVPSLPCKPKTWNVGSDVIGSKDDGTDRFLQVETKAATLLKKKRPRVARMSLGIIATKGFLYCCGRFALHRDVCFRPLLETRSVWAKYYSLLSTLQHKASNHPR